MQKFEIVPTEKNTVKWGMKTKVYRLHKAHELHHVSLFLVSEEKFRCLFAQVLSTEKKDLKRLAVAVKLCPVNFLNRWKCVV